MSSDPGPMDGITRALVMEGKIESPDEHYPHDYPGDPDKPENNGDAWTSDCSYKCGAWAGPSRSGGPEGIDPFGECPKHPNRNKE